MSEVLVTGATGYIARHVVVQLLDAGHVVRGTARSSGALATLQGDLKPFVADPAALGRFSVVAADLTRDDGWDDAVQGCSFVHHVASPLPSGPPKHEDDIIVPARDGTLRVLRAALGAGVERVVVTSSVAAVAYGGDRNGRRFTSADWSDLAGKRIGAYEKSKTIAERAARDFVRDEAAGRMELVTINPGAVLGPMYGNAFSTSNELVKKLLDRAYPATPNLHYSTVDVRDVAAAHVAAMTAPGIDGGRYIIGIEDHSMRDVARVLADHYGPLGYKIPTASLPDFVMRVVALFDKSAALAINDLANPMDLDAGPVVELLDRPLRDLAEMVIAMAESLIEYGLVKQTPKR
jgi:dihydroflavonol-4-reductase